VEAIRKTIRDTVGLNTEHKTLAKNIRIEIELGLNTGHKA